VSNLRRIVIALVVVLAGLAGCSDDTSVGEGVDTEFEEQLNDQLGATTTTATTAPGSNGDAPAATTATTAAAQQATTSTTIPGFEIAINAVGFDPSYSRVLPGTVITFRNDDTQVRSAVGDNGEFDTGDIAPGATATYTAPASGVINFSDGTRPFVTGTIEVTG
jgi:plastocyanin